MDWQSFGIGVCVGMLLWVMLYGAIYNRRPTKHAPDARESGAKIVSSKSKRSAKSARG